MPRSLRRRARLEVFLAAAFAALTLVTLAWTQWIEGLFEVSPDGGSGETEWGITLVFGVLALVCAALGWRDRAHLRTTEA